MGDFDKPSLADLAHHGVKGMHWGVRTADGSVGGSGSSGKPQKMTRKEVRAEKKKFYEDKADRVISEAMKNENTLIKVRTYEGDTILTGKEFITHLSNGGMMNAKYTDVYARQQKTDGPYMLNERMNERYVRSDKKK